MKAMILLATVLASSSSFALVREYANCTTSDGKYQIAVQDNEGIGPVRKQHLSASITSASGQSVATLDVAVDKSVKSISFGRDGYLDAATGGSAFKLQGPSTNFRHYSVDAKIVVDGKAEVLKDDDLQCSIFQIAQ